jgi:hypothetical protein
MQWVRSYNRNTSAMRMSQPEPKETELRGVVLRGEAGAGGHFPGPGSVTTRKTGRDAHGFRRRV